MEGSLQAKNKLVGTLYGKGEMSGELDMIIGRDGKDGTSVGVESVAHSYVDGGYNVVTFTDGNHLTVKNGEKGEKGDRGEKGEDGVMRFEDLTEEQKASLKGDKGADGAGVLLIIWEDGD